MTVPRSRRNGSVHAEVPKLNGRLLVCCRPVSRSQLEFQPWQRARRRESCHAMYNRIGSTSWFV